jgi:hypothetical protein
MFTIDAAVDAVQTAKKTFVNTFVTNDVVKEAMIKFVDAQADYTKRAAKVGTDTVATLTSEAVKAAQESAKFDWVKFNETMLSAYKTGKASK